MTRQPSSRVRARSAGATLRDKNPGVFDVLGTYRGSATVTSLTEELGISTPVFYRWMKEDVEFRDTVTELRLRADERVESMLYQRAVGYTGRGYKPMKVKNDGVEEIEIVEYPVEMAPDVTAQRFWLSNRAPERWAERQVVTDDESYQRLLEKAMKTVEGTATDEGSK